MTVFTAEELEYLESLGPRPLGRVATVGADGTPHVTPVGWRLLAEEGVIEVGGINLTRTKKFRDVTRTGRAAIVIDDVASTDPWRPRGVEIRGRAEAREATGGERDVIRIHVERVVSWGLTGPNQRTARSVAGPAETSAR